jgi:DNA-binding transcriptional LysR family regulator
LTPKGHALLKQAILVFDTLTRMQQTAAEEQNPFSGPVSIALGRDLAIYFARKFAAFSRKYPNVRLTILSKSSDEAASLIVDDVIDIGISRLGKVPRRLQKRTLSLIASISSSPKMILCQRKKDCP